MPRFKPRLRTLAVVVSAAGLLLAPLATRVQADDASASVHVVQPGETLSGIADSVGTDAVSLGRLNGLSDANVLAAGQSLQLPPAATTPPAASPAPVPAMSPAPVPAQQRTYTVAGGDTLWSIAQQLGTSTSALVQANKLDDPDHLGVGSQLVVPAGASPAAPAPAAASAPSSASSAPSSAATPAATPIAASAASTASPKPAAKRSLLVSYTVQPGETLDQIAQQFDVRADSIVQASGLDDPNRLSVGTVLKVPLPGREHVVKPGETLHDIAAQEKVDLGSLVDFNALDDPELIHVGQVVLVPAAPDIQSSGLTASAERPAQAASQDDGIATPAATPTATPVAAATATPAATAQATSAASPSATPKASSTPVARAPVAVVAPPAGAPTDGLAGAGLKLLGAPYVWGGSSPKGFDCSGFVWYVVRQGGKSVSRGLFGEYSAGAHPSKDDLKPGDLVFFQNTYSAGLSHNGIYIGNGQFVHAADENAGVTISSLGTAYWSSHWFGATRLS